MDIPEAKGPKATVRLLLALLKPRRWQLALLAVWALILASMTALYGAAAGPALKAVFGGYAFEWPSLLVNRLPPPPDADQLQLALPLFIVVVALIKGLAFAQHQIGTARLREGVTHELRCVAHRALLRTQQQFRLIIRSTVCIVM